MIIYSFKNIQLIQMVIRLHEIFSFIKIVDFIEIVNYAKILDYAMKQNDYMFQIGKTINDENVIVIMEWYLHTDYDNQVITNIDIDISMGIDIKIDIDINIGVNDYGDYS